MKGHTKIHSASVEAFIEYLKRTEFINLEALTRRMKYNIGWPVETIAYVIQSLTEDGYYPPKHK